MYVRKIKLLVRLLLAALFVFAGFVHLAEPELFYPAMPPWIPFHWGCIVVSGCAELAGGVGLLAPNADLRRWAGWGLGLLLIAVFPANIYMAAAHVRIHGFPAHPWEAWARLPLQPLLFVAVIWATNGWPGTCTKEKTKTNPNHNRQ